MIDPKAGDFLDEEDFEPFRVPNAAELIANHLRRQIVRGELPEGSSLPPENRLRARFGVSGPTLRAAYRVLEAENLITVRRGSRGGARVRRPELAVASRYVGVLLQMDGASLDDLFTARIVLEPPLAAMAAANITKKGVAELRTCLEDEEASLSHTLEFARASSAFHQTVIRLAGNRTLGLLVGLVWHLVELHTARTVTEAGDSPTEIRQRQAALHAHQRLVNLIEQRDAQGAEEFWGEHMKAVGKLFAKRNGGKTLVELFE